MSNEHLKQLSRDIVNIRNSITETKNQLTNLINSLPTINVLNRFSHYQRIAIARLRLRGLKNRLRTRENKLILLLN